MEPFDAIIDEEMEPGDILYIPPGFPHEGYTLENALNYSVGFRAPNGRELVSGFADYVLARELGSKRYGDPDVKLREHPAEILPQEVDALRQMMLDLVQQPEHFQHWFGEFISQSRHELDLAPPEPPYQAGEIYELLQQGEALQRLRAARRRSLLRQRRADRHRPAAGRRRPMPKLQRRRRPARRRGGRPVVPGAADRAGQQRVLVL